MQRSIMDEITSCHVNHNGDFRIYLTQFDNDYSFSREVPINQLQNFFHSENNHVGNRVEKFSVDCQEYALLIYYILHEGGLNLLSTNIRNSLP